MSFWHQPCETIDGAPHLCVVGGWIACRHCGVKASVAVRGAFVELHRRHEPWHLLPPGLRTPHVLGLIERLRHGEELVLPWRHQMNHAGVAWILATIAERLGARVVGKPPHRRFLNRLGVVPVALGLGRRYSDGAGR
jgi:hypothetical protein